MSAKGVSSKENTKLPPMCIIKKRYGSALIWRLPKAILSRYVIRAIMMNTIKNKVDIQVMKNGRPPGEKKPEILRWIHTGGTLDNSENSRM